MTGHGNAPFTACGSCADKLADLGGREVAGDAGHAEAIRPVRRDRDFDHRIVEAHQRREGLSDRRRVRHFDNAVMLVGQAHLAHRDHHALRGLATDFAGLQHHAVAGDRRALACEHADHAGAGVRCAADDLKQLSVALVDLEHAKLVGVRMLRGLDHFRGDEGRENPGAVFDALDFEADLGQPVGDGVEAGIGLQMLFQPG